MPLKIGRIDYLNVWPLFYHLTKRFPPGEEVEYVAGHPSALNALLSRGEIDMAPCSSFEYLLHPGSYDLLPGLSISARREVQSVLLVSPVALAELPEYLSHNGRKVSLTTASATSVALLKILFRHAWGVPDPIWVSAAPGTGLTISNPFLEIGDMALKIWVDPPKGWHVIDLAGAWEAMTRLPFVFGVWIVRNDLSSERRTVLAKIAGDLLSIKERVRREIPELACAPGLPEWIGKQALQSYWETIEYDLTPEHQASLVLFGSLCRGLGLLPSVPALSWFGPAGDESDLG
jgi:chorismate dehydratase